MYALSLLLRLHVPSNWPPHTRIAADGNSFPFTARVTSFLYGQAGDDDAKRLLDPLPHFPMDDAELHKREVRRETDVPFPHTSG